MTEGTLSSLKGLIGNALKYTEMERDDKSVQDGRLIGTDETYERPVIKVVGIGGAGNNTINRLYNIGLDETEIIGINTDKQHLDVIKADKKILIGKSLTRGLGAGGSREIGRRAAELARSTLREVLGDSDVVFITAGMGGGTGSGATPVVAEIAKEQGSLVVALVSTPFKVEQAHYINAEPGLSNLKKTADTVIALDLNVLLEIVPKLPLEQTCSLMDQIISETVRGISLALTSPSLMNLDLEDFKAIASKGGDAVLLVGECRGRDRYEKLAETAMSYPLNNADFHNAKGALILVTGGPEMTVEDAEGVIQSLTRGLGSDIRVARGARCDKGYEGKARIVAIMAGIE